MEEQRNTESELPNLPSKYWSTLTHHNQQSPSLNAVDLHFDRLDVDLQRHDLAVFQEFTYGKSPFSPSSRTCSSLLSEMLRAIPGSQPSSPATTHNDLSDHGELTSYSTQSTPPLQATPPKRNAISFGVPATRNALQLSPSKPLTVSVDLPQSKTPCAARHISFGALQVSDTARLPPVAALTVDGRSDASGEATPVARKTIQFASHDARRAPTDMGKLTSAEGVKTGQKNRSIKFAAPAHPPFSTESSRRSSITEHHMPVSADTSSCSPSLVARPPVHATCKSTLDAMLKKEAIAKVIEPVDEEDEEEDDLDAEEEDDEDDRDSSSNSDIGSDDDGYAEDNESDEDALNDADIYPQINSVSETPRKGFAGPLDVISANAMPTQQAVSTPIFRTAAPSESDLPDTTDFVPGTIDEDQPACIAFDMAVRDREARRRPAKPSDIDPTFPDSGSEEDEFDVLDEADITMPKINEGGHMICRSPAVQTRIGRQHWNSPPIARACDTSRARSLPRRYLTGRKALYEPKPQRAVTIKQSNEKRAERRREKKEVRHNLRRGNKPVVDHNGHEKMKVHCLSRKKLIANENPCVIRPVMSI